MVVVVDKGDGSGRTMFVVFDDTQIKCWHLLTLDLGIIGHSTDSTDSIPL
jgi:hypothetical protein